MGTPSFRFKQFEVFHDRCAMKVGTDGVVLGAWSGVESTGRILDVGTGSGLIALILAQRTQHFTKPPRIEAIEYDASASQQAAENVLRSPWSNRIVVHHADFRQFSSEKYDLIVSNPPFFRKVLKAPVAERSGARHDVTLSFEELVEGTRSLLADEGRFSVVLPAENAVVFEAVCNAASLYVNRRCDVTTVAGKIPRRVLFEFSRKTSEYQTETLFLSNSGQTRSEAYSALTADLYL